MSVGLLALLDDVAGIVKVTAASLDDVLGMSAKAGLKASGALIDDAAVTPKYVHGLHADRELPIVWRIAKGSIKNKLVFLLPAALLLSAFLPWLITPLLMVGGCYLAYEGAEKVLHAVAPKAAHEHEESIVHTAIDPTSLEDQKVAGAIKTDFILSAEIMAIALGELPGQSIWFQAIALLIVAIGITIAVYGAVALIVRADDLGLALAKRDGALAPIGRAIVQGMPGFMNVLMIVGTIAMIWVGGGIIVHGLESFGLHAVEAAMHDATHAVESLGGFATWFVKTALYFVAGIVSGAVLIPIVQYAISPIWRRIKSMLPKRVAPQS